MKPWEVPTSKLGAGAVILQDDRNRQQVLLVRLNYGPAKGQWAVPGGRVEAGEKIHDAVVREAEEETGVKIQLAGMIAVRQRLMPNGLTDIYFMFRARPLNLIRPEDLKWPTDEIQEARLWDVQTALSSPKVRPMAKAALGVALNSEASVFELLKDVPGVSTETDTVFTHRL